jgi:hypothetical protein
MADLITENGRKAIKKIAEISQCARVLSLMPTAEDFALKLIGDLRRIGDMVNRISRRINEILERYSSIPTEFLLKGFDEILYKLDNISDYAKFAIDEATGVMSSTVKSAQEITSSLTNAADAVSSAVLQIGGGLTYGAVAMSANIKLALTGNGRRQMTNDVVQDTVAGEVPMTGMEAEIDKRIEDNVGGMDSTAKNIKNKTTNAINKYTINKTTEETNDEFEKEETKNVFEKVGRGLDKAQKWIDSQNDAANKIVDGTIGTLNDEQSMIDDQTKSLIDKVENAKKAVEDKIEDVKRVFDNLIKKFDEAFGFVGVNGKYGSGISPSKNFAEEVFRNISNTAYEKMDTPVYDAIGEVSEDIADFIKNFSIGKTITAFGGIVVGAAAATLAMDLLPNIDVDKMLKSVIGGYDSYRVDKMTELYNNKYYEDEPDGITDLCDVPDSFWKLSKDDVEKYNSKGYEEYLNKYNEGNEITRTEILESMQFWDEALSDLEENKDRYNKEIYKGYRKTYKNINKSLVKENRQLKKENKSALKAMRKVRRDAIKARQIERYKGFLNIELEYLKRECQNVKNNIQSEWDSMMNQYKAAIDEIKRFFSKEGCGGSEAVDRCCDRINRDAEEIKELCANIKTELTNSVSNIAIPYAIGSCVDMPVHKILEFFKDLKIIVTFLKNLIRLGVDIISQLSILAKIVANGFQSLAEIMQTLKDLIGVDKIMNMIDFLVALFRPKMMDAKALLENAVSPIYYNETEDYENKMDDLEKALDKLGDDADKDIEKLEKDIEDLEITGEEQIVAYRSPILNSEGDDFAGWIYFHATASESYLKEGWKNRKIKKKRLNRLIKKASKKNKMKQGKLVGGVAQLKNNKHFGSYENKEFIKNVSDFKAFYWYTKWTNDPTDCEPDFSNGYDNGGNNLLVQDEEGNLIVSNYLSNKINRNVVNPVMTTSNGSLVELNDGRRVFVKDQTVKSGDFVNVDGQRYRVK